MADHDTNGAKISVFKGLFTDDACEVVAVIDETVGDLTISGPMSMDMLERNLNEPDKYGLSESDITAHREALESVQDFLAEGNDPSSLSHWEDDGNEHAEPNQKCQPELLISENHKNNFHFS
jgi:hypothetical protein